jgi:hypothetical protein
VAKRWAVGPGVWIIIYMFVFSLVQQMALAICVQGTMNTRGITYEQALDLAAKTQVPFILALSALIGLPIFFLLVTLRKESWPSLIFQKLLGWRQAAGLFLLGILLNQAATWILYMLQSIPALENVFRTYLQSMDTMTLSSDPRQMILLMGVVVPVYEEVLFRGLVFSEFAKMAPVKAAMIAQALIFGIWHGTLIQGIYAFLLGILLGRVYIKYRSVWASIAVHCGFNIASYLLLWLVNLG